MNVQAQPAAVPPPGGGTAPNTPFRYGRILVRPHVSYSYNYNQGILVLPGQPEDTEQSNFSPGVLIELGDRLQVDYTGTATENTNSAFRDSWGHAVRMDGGLTGANWALKLSQSYTSKVTTLIETGRETAHETFTSSLGLLRQLPAGIAYQGMFDVNLRFVEALPDTHEFATTQGLSYQYSSQFGFGVAVMGGYSATPKTADAVSVSPLLQINWEPGDKLTVSLNGGYQHRVLLTPDRSETSSPVFSSSLKYQIFNFTTVSVTGTKAMSQSLLDSQLSKAQAWTGSLEQRVLKHLLVSVSGSRQTTNFVSVTPAAETVRRHDLLRSFDVRLSTTVLRRGSIAVSYQETRNTSDAPGFNVSSRQIGVQAGFSY